MSNRNNFRLLPLVLALTSLLPFFSAPRAWALPHPQQQDQQALDPLLTTISKDPELSIFYSLFNSTGGAEGKPGPALEERFNDARDGRRYTAFAPTNEAFSQIPQEVVSLLIQPPSYELLLALLRTHIAQGFLSPSSLLTDSPIETIQGFTLTFTHPTNSTDTTIATNANTTPSSASPADLSTNPPPSLLHNPQGHPLTTPASNGLLYKTTHFLPPFPTYFGADAPASPPAPPPASLAPTMASILETHPALSTLAAALRRVNPAFVARLALFAADGDDGQTVFLAPGDAAWAALPAGAGASAVQPSNEGASAWLLGFGLGEVVVEGGAELRGREAEGEEKCDLVFGVWGWREVCGHGGGRAVEKREVSVRNEGDGCDWRFGVWGWKKHCPPRAGEKRAAEASNAGDSGCDWRFGVGGWKKFCPPGYEQHKHKCDWEFSAGGWKKADGSILFLA
ncbi:hypothetical protein GTA08_BOTSDO00201 [Neofusicoccum parvum]|nr:hypothetical protein GTA08_BOTSDO00201 [Neofusicoccum parvum]